MRSNHLVAAIGAAVLLTIGAAGADVARAGGPTNAYAISSADLGVALNELAAQSHSQILYAPALVAGKDSGGLAGDYSVQQALNRLLRGTGLHAERVNGNTWVVRRGSGNAPGAAQQTQKEKNGTPEQTPAKKPTALKAVQVTGSLIPAQVETAAPTIHLTGVELTRRGFNTVYQALRAIPLATGAVPGPQGHSTYTTGAQKLSLFGLPPGFTLVMVDGHPLPDYPLLYQGTSNFADLSSIPMALVDHIDIVPGNQSAVYGSSAIAGVVNIVLKKHVKGLHLGLRGGTYSQGGGTSERFELVGGHSWLDDRLDLTYGFQFAHQKPIWARDRSLTATTASNPTTPTPVANPTFRHGIFGPREYLAPPPGACKSVSRLYDGTTYLAHGSLGDYCGTNTAGNRTLMNGEKQYSGYASATFQMDPDTTLYGTAMYTVASQWYAPLGGYIWLPNLAGLGLFVDQSSGSLSTAWRQLSPEEQDYTQSETRNSVHSYQIVAGARGYFGGSNWGYNAYADRAEQIINNRQLHPLTDKVNAFFRNQFLGPELGVDSATGYPIFNPDWAKFYQPITPAQYRSFSSYVSTRSTSSIEHATVLVHNSDLFALPGGPGRFAAQLQAGHQTWDNPTDPRVVNGDFWGLSGTSGGGTRSSYSAAAELNLPVTRMLTVDTAARYDDYKFAGRNDGKATWRVGLEFRPTDTLLLRANYATAFRAPDMGRIFLAPSNTFLGVTDYYLCDVRQPGIPLANCAYNNVQTRGVDSGNRNLKDITAKSWGAGIVWSPASAFNLHVDYLHINIANEITDLSVNRLMRDDRDCLEGKLDANSPTCVDTIARVQRDKVGNITLVRTGPINIATEKVQTLTVGINSRLPTSGFGTFTFNAEYNDMLKHNRRRDPGDPVIDLLGDPTQSTEFKTIANASVDWAFRAWNVTLFAVRYGKTPNFTAQLAGYSAPGAGKLGAWTLYNMSVARKLPGNLRLALSVNNVFNKAPPRDSTYSRWPYYNTQNYNLYGRAYYLQLNWTIGGDQ